MKKTLMFILLFMGTVVLVGFGIFFWKNLRGIGPAVKGPSADIAQLIEKAQAGSNAAEMPLAVPTGFKIEIFAKDLGNPRVMVRDPDGNILVSIPSQGRVLALADHDHDGRAERVSTVIDRLNRPHGMAFRCAPDCKLYIAEEDQVNVYSYDLKNRRAVKEKKIADLPAGGNHTTRTLLFHPKPYDNLLLVSVGSSCNMCDEEDWRRAKVLVVPAEGGALKTFASGLRNAVFMAVHPRTNKVWATEMGGDLIGDDLPPDEIDILELGRNYGWPYCYGKNVHDDDFDLRRTHRCVEPETLPSYIDIPAHSAPLGLAFFPQTGWPEEFRNDMLVSYHGSWNRSVPTGYKIVRYHLDSDGAYLGREDFMTGWLTKEGRALGRPADIMIQSDGSIFVSDDKSGVIYRISRMPVK